MNNESGRSLIEVIGVMALSAIMLAGTFQVYRVVRARMVRMEAAETLGDIAKNARLLFSARGNYSGISTGFLIKAGALKTDRAPSIATEYDIQSAADGETFYINLSGMNFNNCAWIATQKFDWASDVYVNDSREGAAAGNCKKSDKNKVSIVVK
ncbi:MAG: hypothetical protein LBK26_00115 [Rickettsiales bacterium]|jgi:hypothetical protein|nr:hypothetical protein [Rickettsiales bacterium]